MILNEIIKQDLEYFLEKAETSHLNIYFLHTKEELNKYIEDYIINNKVNDKYEQIIL